MIILVGPLGIHGLIHFNDYQDHYIYTDDTVSYALIRNPWPKSSAT